MKYIVSFKESGERLDKAVALLNQELSRSFITKLLKEGKILVNDKVEKPSFKVKENDVIFIEEIVDVKADIKEEDIPLDIVYEDDDILIINKPQGMVVHPANGHYSGTLVNALMFQEESLSSPRRFAAAPKGALGEDPQTPSRIRFVIMIKKSLCPWRGHRLKPVVDPVRVTVRAWGERWR